MSRAMFVCDKSFSCCDHQYWDSLDQVEQEAKECGHLIEVAPVVHGRWKQMKVSRTQYVCSECGDLFPDYRSNYCPNCGARMEGE